MERPMRRLPIALLLVLATVAAHADVFTLPLKLRQANEYLDNDRFRAAETLLATVYDSVHERLSEHPDQSIRLLGLLAKARSQQGKFDTVADLLLTQHRLIAANYSHTGYVYASSLARIAEAHYRDRQKYDAIDFSQRAIAIYQRLNPVPQESLDLISRNLAQYRIAPFSRAFLPRDLSDFYARCERLQQSKDRVTADQTMSAFVEVGVDYVPQGRWVPYFYALKYPNLKAFEGKSERRIFIPDQSHALRDEICIVEEVNGIVINAMTVLE